MIIFALAAIPIFQQTMFVTSKHAICLRILPNREVATGNGVTGLPALPGRHYRIAPISRDTLCSVHDDDSSLSNNIYCT